MFASHAMNQPAATMPNPYGGEVRDGAPYDLPGEVVLGKGVSEQKATMAAMLLAIETNVAHSNGPPIHGRLVFLCCLSGETGRHDAIRSIIETFRHQSRPRRARRHRQRSSASATADASTCRSPCTAAPCHSSRPVDGCNAVTGAFAVIRRISSNGVKLTASHPQLGKPSASRSTASRASRKPPTPSRIAATSCWIVA